MADNFIEKDWMDHANCAIQKRPPEDYDKDGKLTPEQIRVDTVFIRKPDGDEEEQWHRICMQCPVFHDCLAWADRLEVNGVYAAGEWRE